MADAEIIDRDRSEARSLLPENPRPLLKRDLVFGRSCGFVGVLLDQDRGNASCMCRFDFLHPGNDAADARIRSGQSITRA